MAGSIVMPLCACMRRYACAHDINVRFSVMMCRRMSCGDGNIRPPSEQPPWLADIISSSNANIKAELGAQSAQFSAMINAQSAMINAQSAQISAQISAQVSAQISAQTATLQSLQNEVAELKTVVIGARGFRRFHIPKHSIRKR